MKATLRIDPKTLGDHPLFSTAEAESWGVSRHDLAILVRRGLIWRVARGWYSCRTDVHEDERHILRTVAVLRLHGEDSVACRQSAALIHELPLARTDLSVVEVAKVNANHGRTRQGFRVSELGVDRGNCAEVFVPIVGASVRVVDPATAVVGTAMINNPMGALVAGDHALRHGLCTRTQIDGALELGRGATGIGAAREAMSHLEPRHESPGETLTAAVLRRSPWAFDPQVKVMARGRRYRLDFALREYRVALEFDGAIKYTGPEVMEAQLEREGNLRAEGWVVVRFGWDDLEDEGEMFRRISAAVDEARAAAGGSTVHDPREMQMETARP